MSRIHRGSVWLLAAAVGASLGVGCRKKGVQRPDPDTGLNTPGYCAGEHLKPAARAQEDNCMACTARPGCGWCAAPTGGANRCQPASGSHPDAASCDGATVRSDDGCEAPPPPPLSAGASEPEDASDEGDDGNLPAQEDAA